MPAWFIKFIGTIIFKAIRRKREWRKIDEYVNKPNELDKELKKIKKELKKLKKLSHPVSDFVCTKCGTKAKRVKRKLKKIKERL